jgi:hypothetical protein
LGPLGVVSHDPGDRTTGEREQLHQAPAARAQLGQAEHTPCPRLHVHAEELLAAGGTAGDKQPRYRSRRVLDTAHRRPTADGLWPGALLRQRHGSHK